MSKRDNKSAGFIVVWTDGGGLEMPMGADPECDGGIQAYGVTASTTFLVSKHVGFLLFGKYDRLTGDPADSPIVLTYGSRDQFSFGGALTYTFGPGVK